MLRPHTVGEMAILNNPYLARQRDEWRQGPWPHCCVQKGHRVWLNGLTTRLDLNGTCGMVMGLCFSTQRIGVSVMGGKVIYVVVERLTPFAEGECPPGSSRNAYDDGYVADLRAGVLQVVKTASLDERHEIGVDMVSLQAAVNSIFPVASVDEVLLTVADLVDIGDLYTTIDADHFLAV